MGEDESQTRNAAGGIFCNAGYSPIRVKNFSYKSNRKRQKLSLIVLWFVCLEGSHTSQLAQKVEFDGEIAKFRSRKRGEINTKLVNWV